MPRKVVIARLPTKNKAVREEFVQRLADAADFAYKNEPGVLKYAPMVPRDDADDTTVFVVEEYADEAAFDEHMAQPHVQSMVEWMGTGNVLGGEPRLFDLQYLDGFDFSRKEVAGVQDPFVAFAELDYKPDTVQQSIPYWKAVVETGRQDEPGTLVYGILKDPKESNKLFALEVYESKEYLTNVHVPSKAIQESIKNTKHLREGLRHEFLKVRGGYLYKA